MGSGSWSRDSFVTYSCCTKTGATVDSLGIITNLSSQEMFKQQTIDDVLKPYKIMRKCCDTEEHPKTIPVILGLDVSGSMNEAAIETASTLNKIMENLLSKVKDVEFCVMGIGDLSYDSAPIQMSQFESDIRIAEHLDKVYFEFGGGGNSYESYTAAWYMGSRHTDLDCWKRGKKGIIITMGDETMNPYLPKAQLERVTGDNLQADIETKILYEEVKDKYDVYHIFVEHNNSYYRDKARETFTSVIPKQNYYECTINALADTIVDIITGNRKEATNKEGIAW